MAPITIALGALLSIVAGVFYVVSQGSVTALLPLGIGLPLLICGIIALSESKRKHAMHAAAVFGLLGLLGSLMGAPKWPKILAGQEVERAMAAWEQLLMFLICVVFIALTVKSFAAARRARENKS